MQRDTELTFMDIHGTPNAMLASLEDIVCSENFTSTSVEQPLDLRFLEVDTINSNDQNPILRLTEKGQYIGNKDYVAVSYTWQRFDPITNTEAISRFRVSVGGSVRKARSQDAVLHRAIEFARSTNTPRIWIDQDCIEQYDPDDLQQHLHVVHKIFQQSQHAIALLSFHIRHQHQADSIRCINQGTFLDELEMPLEMAADVISGLADTIARTYRLFAAVATDKWFTRTWTLMERLSAPHMYFLLPQGDELSQESMTPTSFSDLRLDPQQMYDLQKRLERFTYRSTHTSHSLKLEHWPQAFLLIVKQFNSLLTLKFLSDFQDPPWTQTPNLWQVTDVFRYIERCDNTVQSDRLLILGYLCGFSWRLETVQLNHYKYSYSTCLFALLVINGVFKGFEEILTPSLLWHCNIEEVLTHCLLQADRASGINKTVVLKEQLLFCQGEVADIFLSRIWSIFRTYLP